MSANVSPVQYPAPYPPFAVGTTAVFCYANNHRSCPGHFTTKTSQPCGCPCHQTYARTPQKLVVSV